jgi:peptide/nickel transport system substrate-binding protein
MTITRRTAIAAGLSLPFVARNGAAQAQAPSRSETLLLVQEYGPNSLDMQGIGSSQPVNGVALNCYDRLLRFKPAAIRSRWVSSKASWRKAGSLPQTA